MGGFYWLADIQGHNLVKANPCKLCNSQWHTKMSCPLKKKKRLSWQSPKTKYMEEVAKDLWFKANPPDQYGQYLCYLRISPDCPTYLNVHNVVQEHVVSKTHAPELKYDISNRKPACAACNKLKGGRWLEDIEEYIGNYN